MVLLLFVLLGGIALLLFTSLQAFDLLNAAGLFHTAGRPVRISTFVLLFAIGAYGLYRLMRAIGGEAVVVIITPSQLSVLYHKRGDKVLVPFKTIAAYHYLDFNGNAELSLKLLDASRLKLAINSRFQDTQHFTEMVQAFEAALYLYQDKQVEKGQPAVQLREKTFFERSISTVFLVGMLVLIADTTWTNYSGIRPVNWGSTVGLYGMVIAFVGAWIAARGKRRQ